MVLRFSFCQVEEIEDIDEDSIDPFVAEAVANEKELVLSEEQRKSYRKVGQYSYVEYYDFPFLKI
jgi:hypothetical protein